MAKMTYNAVMKLKLPEFSALIANNNHQEWVHEAAQRTEMRERYPRMKAWNEEKEKYVYVANKDEKTIIEMVPISFMSLKRAYCAECLNIQPVKKEKKTFRDILANM